MGYNLVIGEAIFEGDKTLGYITVWARSEAHDTAPVFVNDAVTLNTNFRSPSYNGWSEFCRDVGLYDEFYQESYRETPILAEHPGYALLTPADVKRFKGALKYHTAKYGNIEPGFLSSSASANRARLLWLIYWSDWAVKTCEWPVFVNS